MKSAAFETALDAVYAAFAAPTPRVIAGCPCCLDTRKTDILLSKPLRELSESDLARYGAGVFYTVGGVQDFRYLLPPMLELVARNPGCYPSAEIVVGKLKLSGWTTWRPAERQALMTFLDAWFDQVLAETRDTLAEPDAWGNDSAEVEALLCGLARAEGDISPWLERLLLPEWIAVLRNFAHSSVKTKADGPVMASGFWEDCPDQAREVLAFLDRAEVRALLD